MKRLTLLTAALLAGCLFTGALAQNTQWFDMLAKGSGIAANGQMAANFELLAIQSHGKLVGSLMFVGMANDATRPVVVTMDLAHSMTVTGKLAVIEGEGLLNDMAAKVHIEANDLASPGSPLDVLDQLTLKVAAADGTTFGFTGYVKRGDIVVIGPPPPPPHYVYGHGVIQVNNNTKGVLDIKVVAQPTSSSVGGITGSFVYVEDGPSATVFPHTVKSVRILALVVDGRKASLKAEVLYNGRKATATLAIADNRAPTDPATNRPDFFELHVYAPDGTELYKAAGPLIDGDLVVK